MALSYAVKCESLRWLFRTATTDGSTVEVVLNGLADTMLSAAVSGKGIISASGGGLSSSYAFFDGWDPQTVLGWVNWARGYQSESDAEDAIALVALPAKSFRHDFTGISV